MGREDRHELVAVLRDAGVSGTREAADRPGLSEAVSLVEIGEANGIVVAKLDRLARTLVVQGHPRQGLVDGGSRQLDRRRRGHAGRPRRSDEDCSPSDNRRLRSDGTRHDHGSPAGRRYKHLKGGYAYGASGSGFSAEGGSLILVPHEQAVIARMSQLRVAGMSLRAIAAQLDLEDLRQRRATRSGSSSVGRILARLEEAAEIAT